MRNTKRWLIVFIITFALLSVIGLALSIVNKEDKIDSQTEAGSLEDENIINNPSGVPRVVSVNPSVVNVESDFSYYLKIVDSDSDISNLEIEILEGPEWMKFDESEFHLYGNPEIELSNSVNVKLRISDGDNIIIHKFYMLVVDKK